MGVRGLSTFIGENSAKFLQKFKLQDTKIVIDGSNLLYFLYSHFEDESVYGGNYDHFSTICRDFFNTLLKCNIMPIVVFDGAHDPNNMKLETVLKRLDKRFEKVRNWETEEVLPILSEALLYQILDELKIPHIATVYEADREIAVLANRYQCPVLTDDSDFYVYNLKGGVISMASMFEKKRTDINGRFFLPVKLYKRDIVVRKLFHMENDEYIFPVFATLTGNDFFDPSGITLNYSKRPREMMSFEKRDIRTVKEFICEAGSGKSALEHICSQLTQEKKEQFHFSVDFYLDINNFTLFDLEEFIEKLEYKQGDDGDLSKTDTQLPNHESLLDETCTRSKFSDIKSPEEKETEVRRETNTDETTGKKDVIKEELPSETLDQSSTIQHHTNESSLSECISLNDKNGNKLPAWFIHRALRCKMECTFLLNISQNHLLLFKAQPEICNKPSSFKCAEKIRRIIYRLVLNTGDNSGQAQQRMLIQEYHRKRTDLSQVKPIERLEFVSELPRLENIPSLPTSERKAIVYATFKAELSSFDQEMDETSEIIILMLSLWMATCNPKECYVNAILIGIIALHVVQSSGSTQCLDILNVDILNAIKSTDKQAIDNFKGHFGEHFKKQDYMTRRGKEFVHKMSQFQAIFLHTYHLNKLLFDPVRIPSPSVVLNSTFNYNMCHLLENNVRLKNIFLEEESPLYRLLENWQHAIAERYNVLLEDWQPAIERTEIRVHTLNRFQALDTDEEDA